MALKTYSCAEIALAHADMLSLQKAGALTLGIGNAIAEAIARTPVLQPQHFTFKPSSNLRNWIAVGVFAFSIYLAIVEAWWIALFGFAFMLMLGKSTRKLNIEKILAAAEIDAAFYERHRELGNWLYRIDEDKAAPFMKQAASAA